MTKEIGCIHNRSKTEVWMCGACGFRHIEDLRLAESALASARSEVARLREFACDLCRNAPKVEGRKWCIECEPCEKIPIEEALDTARAERDVALARASAAEATAERLRGVLLGLARYQDADGGQCWCGSFAADDTRHAPWCRNGRVALRALAPSPSPTPAATKEETDG